MTKRDADILLGLAVIVVGFVAFEMAGLLLPGWHTISYYAAHNAVLDYFLLAAFVLGGLGGAVWFWFHIRRGIPK